MKNDEVLNIYNPSDKDIESRAEAYRDFDVMWENQRREYNQFNSRTLQDYLDDSRKTMNLMANPREDGRSNVKSVTPLNKLHAILARTALTRPKIAVTATNKNNILDDKRGLIINDLYQYSEENIELEETADVEYFFDSFDTLTDGTIIKYEGYDNQTHKQKKITDYDPDTGDIKYEEVEYKTERTFSQKIQPEDFFIYNPYMRSLQKQPKVGWRQTYSSSAFNYEFSGYKNAKFVKSRDNLTDALSDSYYKDKWFNRIEKDEIEVLRIFDRWNDRMIIVANGVVLQDSPLPWNNGEPKKYPFSKTISAKFAGVDFFWGMTLAHKLEGDVSSLETLHNLGIEQAKLAVNPPTLTTSENETEDNILLPGREIIVDDIKNFRELQFKSPDSSYFNFIEQIGKNIDLASVDPVAQGQNVSGVTARGQVIAEENAKKLLGQFNLMMESLVLQKAKLRIPNIIQFQIVPATEFRIENTTIDGESGVREIKIIDDISEAETPKQIAMIEKYAEFQGINLERLNITKDYFVGIKYSIKVVTESAFQQAKSIEIALQNEKMGVLAQFFPNIFQSASELFFKDFMKAHGDDSEKYLDAVKQNVDANSQQLLQQGGQQGGAISGELTKEPTLTDLQ